MSGRVAALLILGLDLIWSWDDRAPFMSPDAGPVTAEDAARFARERFGVQARADQMMPLPPSYQLGWIYLLQPGAERREGGS